MISTKEVYQIKQKIVALGVVKVILDEEVDHLESGLFVEAIANLAKGEKISCSFCRRPNKFLAHLVAHAAAEYGDFSVFFGCSSSLALEEGERGRDKSIPLWFNSSLSVNVIGSLRLYWNFIFLKNPKSKIQIQNFHFPKLPLHTPLEIKTNFSITHQLQRVQTQP